MRSLQCVTWYNFYRPAWCVLCSVLLGTTFIGLLGAFFAVCYLVQLL